jgi:hypothetical protein
MMQESKRLYEGSGPNFFPGSTVAGFNQNDIMAQNLLKDKASETAQFRDTNVMPAVQTGLNSYDVANNPVVQRMAQASTQPIIQQLNEEVLPNIRSGAIAQGSLGGSRQALAEGQGMGRAAQAAMNTSAGVYGSAYGQGLGLLSSNLGQMPAIQNLAYQPGQVLAGVGEQQRNMEQSKINEDIARYTYNEQLPYQKLTEYSNLIGKPFGGQSTSEVTATGGETGQTIGGVLAGLGTVLDLWRKYKELNP